MPKGQGKKIDNVYNPPRIFYRLKFEN